MPEQDCLLDKVTKVKVVTRMMLSCFLNMVHTTQIKLELQRQQH